jgi:uncharacterized protein involved in cysteine biosynthesis
MTNFRWAAERLRDHATGPTEAPPPADDEHVDRVLYGFARPAIGARVIVADPELLKAALWPAAITACVCLWASWLSPGEHGRIRRFYELFAILAPMPSLFMARHYAKLAAEARIKMGFGPARPCVEPLGRALRRLVGRAILISLAVAPLFLLRGVPLLGHIVWKVVWAAWALHWIVVDAFDSARVLLPGQTLKDIDDEIDRLPKPWFVRLMQHWDFPPLHWLGRACDRLARPWRDELAMVERHPSLMIGFALSTAVLLATPVLNLLFRPIVMVAATGVLGRLGEAGASDKLLLPPAA